MSFYNELLATTEQSKMELYQLPIIQRALTGDISHAHYVAFLTEAYHHVKHTVPLLMGCGSHLPERLEWLREAMGEYIEEEMGHQRWILNDIKACDTDPETVRLGKPSMATDVMVAYAYDMVSRKNPVSFLGMVHVLEGTSTALADSAASSIQSSLGLPKKAFSYLISHGGLDIEHVAFFEKLVNQLERKEDQQAVIDGARVMYKLYGAIFQSIDDQFQAA